MKIESEIHRGDHFALVRYSIPRISNALTDTEPMEDDGLQRLLQALGLVDIGPEIRNSEAGTADLEAVAERFLSEDFGEDEGD